MERISYYDPNTKLDRKALKEVWEILSEYGEEINRIPEKYLYVIEDNMDKDYDFELDELDTSLLSKETKRIITYLYTDFLSTPEERDVLKKLESIQYNNKYGKEKIHSSHSNNSNDVYNGSIFKNITKENEKIIEEQHEDTESNLPIEYKKTPFYNIITKIKSFIKKLLNKE